MWRRSYHTVKALYQLGPQQEVDVKGWIQSIRLLKKIAFIDLRDGTSSKTLKVAIPIRDSSPLDLLKSIKTGQSISISSAQWLPTPHREQPFELKVVDPLKRIQVLGDVTPQYPLQKKSHTLQFLRTLPHLKHRSNYMGSLLRFRSHVELALANFFQQQHFTKVTPPLLTSSDCEGAGELFKVDSTAASAQLYFGRQTYLTVSTQLHLEALALALSKCWTLTPCFRAEKSDTNRHLSEFWMLEAEWCFPKDVHELTHVAENMVKAVVKSCLGQKDELIPPIIPEECESAEIVVQRWQNLLGSRCWPTITYTEAIEILATQHKKQAFPKYEPKWGSALQSEHEKWLAGEYFKSPVFVTDYPRDCKAFYMKQNDDEAGKETVACFDLLVPGMGEVAGGSMREDNLDKLVQEMDRRQMNRRGDLDWYVALRKEGSAPHGGYGLGVERLISYLYGNHNIRDAIPFHRSATGTIEL
ncbi:SLM5 (YCR024C) [Zygosaccharomyces parabailii]|nr:SLM5 (YCR024C) [Zygosaccharomyces parabailii]CDH16557.1 probable SLM5-Asparaginyl-tRNA synthetase,mitochondrial [Zygosaccharomyces bailii ISA1307]